MCFVRKNKFSNQKELKLFARPFESFIFGAFISSKIKKSYQGLTYKKDTDEVKRVLTIIDKLSKANHLQSFVDRMSVVVLHNTNTVALYTSLNSTLFVTVETLKLAATEEQLSLIVAHELAHYLSDHNC